jgi:hypothetical protein
MCTPSGRRLLVGIMLAMSLSLVAMIQGQPSRTYPTWPIENLPSELRPVVSRADLVIAAIHDSLLWELNAGLEQGGATQAIKSCHVDATRVAQRVARAEGVAAGRTSDRLRNPYNAPRAWAADLVKSNAGRRASDVEGYAVDLGERIGVLRPIVHRDRCAGCHGTASQLAAAVRAELAQRYPGDQAIGFSEGEIRGWYWAELPKQTSR